MSLTRPLVFALVLTAAATTATPTARADAGLGASTRSHIQAAILAGWGQEFVQGLSGLGRGFGVRGGYTLGFGLYVGATVTGHLGEGERARISGVAYENRHWEYLTSLDIGYDFVAFHRWVIRLGTGVGLLLDNARTTIGSATRSSHDLYGFIVAPRLTTFVLFGHFFVGLDASAPLYPSALVPRLAATVYLIGGLVFPTPRAS